MDLNFSYLIWYRRAADTRKLSFSSSFTSSRNSGLPILGNDGPQIHSRHLISAARRYQGTIVINFNHIISYRRPANTIGIQRSRVGHLHSIDGLRVAVSGSDLLCPASSSSIGGSTPPIGGLSLNPLLHRRVDTILSANTAARST